jgi:hypothetical protein
MQGSRSQDSRSVFSFRELWGNGWFLLSLSGSTAVAAGILTATVAHYYSDRILVRPIKEVVRVDHSGSFDVGSFDVKPISEITEVKSENTPRAIAWTGWVIRLSDLCQTKGGAFSSDFSNAFQKGSAKLMVSGTGGQWTVANANVTADTCTRVNNDEKRSTGVYAIFDSKIPTISDQVKATFIPKDEETGFSPM